MFLESGCWWKCHNKGKSEWTYEGGRKRLTLVVTDGEPAPLTNRLTLCVRQRGQIRQLGWYRRISSLVPIIRGKTFFR